jgi:hypothetical protein
MKRVRLAGEGPSDGAATPRRSLSLTMDALPGDPALLVRSRSSVAEMETQQGREPQSPLVLGQTASPALRDMCSPGSDLEWEPSQPGAHTQEGAAAGPPQGTAWARFTVALEREDPRFSCSLPGVQLLGGGGDSAGIGATTLHAHLAEAIGAASARVVPSTETLYAEVGDAQDAVAVFAPSLLGSRGVEGDAAAAVPFGSQQSLDAARGPGVLEAWLGAQARALDARSSPLPPVR